MWATPNSDRCGAYLAHLGAQKKAGLLSGPGRDLQSQPRKLGLKIS
jgi:hypothetical protein